MVNGIPTDFARVRSLYEARFPGSKLYDEKDWARLEFASSLSTGDSVVDFGTGPGVLVQCLAESKKFRQITALDIKVHSKCLRHSSVDYYLADLREPMPSNISGHDTVFCMEVIEHVEEEHNGRMLKALRQLANKRLVVTVPFNEPEPVWWHDKPGGHRQRFTLEKVGSLFPNAIATLQPRWGVDWLFVLEDSRLAAHSFRIVPKQDFVLATGGAT